MANTALNRTALMSSLALLQWREPLWLLLALYPLLVFLLAAARRLMQRDQYADTALLPWVLARSQQRQQHRLRHTSSILAWACFAIAMAGPRLAEKVYQTDQAQYTEVMIVMDLSQSMAAKDMLPNRLQRARLELLDFLQRADQLRLGLTVFAARPHLLSPMTYDKNVIRHYLTALKPNLLPTAGSDINAALLFASKQFMTAASMPHAILLLSDGNSADSQNMSTLQATAQQLKQQGIQVYSLGVGTPTGQAVVASLDPRFAQTQTAITTLQRNNLQTIARLSNGLYTDVSDDDSDWQLIYDQGIARLTAASSTHSTVTNKILWHELYHWPLLCAVVFFVLALFTTSKPMLTRPVASLFVVLSFAFISSENQPVQAAELTYAQAYHSYQQGKYKQAREQFSQLPGYAARLGEANALYQLEDFPAARNLYIQTMLNADNDQQRATALFNLGNTFYQLKEYILAGQLYRDVLRYQPAHAAARSNLQHAEHEQRLKEAEEALTYRPGSGPRTGRAADNLDLANTQVSLADGKSDADLTLPAIKPEKPETTTLLSQTELVSQNIEMGAEEDWTYKNHEVAELRAMQKNMNLTNTYVWQRLFEQEEGFPAPLTKPYPLKGLAPW